MTFHRRSLPTERITLLVGDCRERMRQLPDCSVDAICCDPPYELGFMNTKNKGWDSSGIAYDPVVWSEALRVLKPGGHLLAFSGTRTYHRMVVAIEDAGFEIRDQIGWLYGEGMPKGHDVSKAIDKGAGVERDKVRYAPRPETSGTMANQQDTRPYLAKAREQGYLETDGNEPVTDEAREWFGWNTALKPAWEPICLARKPMSLTVAANVLRYGTGAINAHACRVGNGGGTVAVGNGGDRAKAVYGDGLGVCDESVAVPGLGRWPANVLHDGSPEVVGAFPRVARSSSGTSVRTFGGNKSVYEHGMKDGALVTGYGDQGTAARFFYTAKASKADRGGDGNTHTTVKPVQLMRYLCRMITPPGGVVLDPFMGSGSTILAARAEGFRAIGIDLHQEHVDIAHGRLNGTLNADTNPDVEESEQQGRFF